ncbi:hypothetical protein [Kitasatospora phosalacinea]|uniref:hypothetical protein n=1 Tax=Kitasatospora phosalacinea TaxID=2065 RepID=UPI000527CE63|nr:hypothetical protein [Kitasatospora phosalacinea]
MIFDYKTLTDLGHQAAIDARELVHGLGTRGIDWVLFSTDPLTEHQRGEMTGYPEPAAHIRHADVPSGKRRGSPDWIDVVTDKLDIARNELLYVGQSNLDWRTAINSGVLYVHALWSARIPGGVTALAAENPGDIAEILDDYLSDAPIWSHQLDQASWSLRSLLPASAVLPSTRPKSQFDLKDVFTYDRRIEVGSEEARDLLMFTVLASAYLEGLIPANPYICVYPSSKVGVVSERLATYLDKATRLFHGYYREDLLVRGTAAMDTSRERAAARRAGRMANVSIATQATTVHIGAKYKGKLAGKTVVVFDDFTTHGQSLEWARILLEAAGVNRVVMLTVGKYGSRHTRYELNAPGKLDPYTLNSLTPADFREVILSPQHDGTAEERTRKILQAAIDRSRQQQPSS